MQNKIITSAITDPSILMPFTSKSLDFIQESLAELSAHIAVSMYGPGQNTISPLFVTVTKTGNVFSNGFFFGGGFIPYWLYLEGADVSAMSNPRAVPTNSWYTSSLVATRPHYVSAPADPVTFSDNVARNAHLIRKYTIVDTASLISGSFDLTLPLQFHRYLSSAISPTGAWSGSMGYRYDSRRGTVVLAGSVSILGSGSYTLPSEARPVATRVISMTFLDDSTYRPGICSIDSSGNVTFTAGFTGSSTRTAYMDGVEFHVSN